VASVKSTKAGKKMLHFLPNTQHTRLVLTQAREIIEDPEHWVKEYIRKGDAFCANGACFEVGVPNSALPKQLQGNDPWYNPDDLQRGTIPEPFWFLRLAVKEISGGAFGNLGRFNDALKTTHAEILAAFDLAIAKIDEEIADEDKGGKSQVKTA
jgi:hypothetical protein